MTDSLLELEQKASDPARYSVQSRAEDSKAAPGSDVNGVGMFWLGLGQRIDEEIPWNPTYPNIRDRFLIDFARKEPMVAAARYSMKTRVSTLNYTMNAPPRTKKFAQELLNNPGLGDNLPNVVQKLSDDLDTSDNGAFLELWRPGSPTSDAGSRPVVGFAHLDSRQCWRSFDPEFPVWYTNPITGAVRKIHRSRVVMASDNPQPIELARGIGFCSVSRALRWTRIIRNILTYTDEKVSGDFTRAIGAVSGITARQLEKGLKDNVEEAERKGFVNYKGIPIFATPGDDAAQEVKIMLQDLASIPDGFDFKTDIELYAYVLAFCFGVDAREFWPISQGLGSKGEATIQNMKARGRGIGNRIQTIEYMIRQCLPATVEFESDFVDDEQDEMQTRIHKDRQTIYSTALRDGGINNLEYRALLIADGIIDGKLLEDLDIPVTSDDNADEEGEVDSLESNTNDSADPTDTAVASMALKATVTEEAVSLKTASDYRKALRSLVRGYWKGDLGAFDFVDSMNSAINRHFHRAWIEGAKAFGITNAEMTDEEKTRLELEINTEISYVTLFADSIEEESKANGGKLGPLFDRVELWVNNYGRIVSLAGSMAAADKKSQWAYGDTIKHCVDCSTYAGRVYRNSVWRKFLEPYDAMPRGHGLACSGFQCDCSLKPTSEPVSKGRPPIPKGPSKGPGKKEHDHPVVEPMVEPAYA